MRNFLISIIVILALLPSGTNPISSDKDDDTNMVYQAMIEDKMSLEDSKKWYTMFAGAEIYGDKFDFVGCNDFSDVFVKMKLIRDTLLPEKGNVETSKAINDVIFKKYEEADFTKDTKSQLTDDLYYTKEGIRAAIDKLANDQ